LDSNKPENSSISQSAVTLHRVAAFVSCNQAAAPIKWNGGDYASTPSGQTAARKFLWSEKISTLGHNLALVSVLYSGERPEMTTQ